MEIQDPFIGPMKMEDVDYEECERCKDRIFPLETARAIDKQREALLNEILKKQPLQDFFTAAEAAAELEITKQALHKSRKVRRGFIYHTTLGGMVFYLKKSVYLYKDKGDGRFSFHQPADESHRQLNILHAPSDVAYTVHEPSF
ncbi:MAG: hypothetical protein WCO89_05355 [Syntrophus sp. (in: bacteria)]